MHGVVRATEEKSEGYWMREVCYCAAGNAVRGCSVLYLVQVRHARLGYVVVVVTTFLGN